MKKIDRYSELFHNTMLQVVPLEEQQLDGQTKYNLKLKVLPPFAYDVIENPKNKEEPSVVILTDFVERNQAAQGSLTPGSDGRSKVGLVPNFHQGDRRVQTIADSPEDAGQDNREFIFWTDKYHFTTDAKGNILEHKSPEMNKNPIGRLPFINFAGDQDGQFWARGGDDLVDGSVLINVLLTDMNAIANVQGWGQLVIKGKNTPKYIQGGPHTAILMEYEKDDPVPDVSFVSSNPPLDTWMRMIEQHVALLLSTNNLSPVNIAGRLDPAQFPSGIAMLIEQSESTAEIQDKQRMFKDKEPVLWAIVKKWMEVFADSNSLNDNLKSVGQIEDVAVKIKFINPKPVISEKEKLETLKMRQDLGISTAVDLIQMDDPDLTTEEAEAKLLAINTENLKRTAMFATKVADSVVNGEEKEEEEPEEEEEEAEEPEEENETDEDK
jgi:hypothetical protein